MRVEVVRDTETGMVRFVLEVPAGADPDRAADVCWAAVTRELAPAPADP